MKNYNDIESMAAALYDGGWRASDRDELVAEYDLDAERVDAIVAKLAEYEYTDDARKIVDAGLYNVAVELMDDDIREDLHIELAPCEDVTFLAAYMARHSQKYGEEFRVD